MPSFKESISSITGLFMIFNSFSILLRPISISLSPNTESDDTWLAFRLLVQPWKWKTGRAIKHLEESFRVYQKADYAISFNSGRSALLAILKSLEFAQNDQVFVQAFTCNAVPNPVMWAGLTPVYVDCREDDFNMNEEDLERKIEASRHAGKNPRAVIAQHTFGIPANLDALATVCKKHNLILIEDCAHALGAKYKGNLVGTFGEAAFFSFSRDKVISSVYGGMATTNNALLAKKIRAFQQKAGLPSLLWIAQQLLHPVAMNWKILPLYKFPGKYLLEIAQRLHLLSKAVHWKEKQGMKPGYFPKSLPNALALLAAYQFTKLERFNAHRREIAKMYQESLRDQKLILPAESGERSAIYLRYPVGYAKAHSLIRHAWKKNLLLGDWYTTPIAPSDTRAEKVQYMRGSCPVAEKLAGRTFNLPTHIRITPNEVKKIIAFLKQEIAENDDRTNY